MHAALPYRGFLIYNDGHEFVAEPQDPTHEIEVFEIGSQSVDRLMQMIDELLHALECCCGEGKSKAPLPSWYQAWLDGGSKERISTNVPLPEVAAQDKVEGTRYALSEVVKASALNVKGLNIKLISQAMNNALIKISDIDSFVPEQHKGFGTGFLIDEHRLITAAHVIPRNLRAACQCCNRLSAQ
jgi:hypothetical protein